MKKTYRIEVDCAACADKMLNAIKNTEGIKEVSLSFMTQKCIIEFEDGADVDFVMKHAVKNVKRIEDDMEIIL